jgi:hypothetical protein
MKIFMAKSSIFMIALSLGLVSLMSCVGFVYVRPNPEDQQARITINRTNDILQDAQNSVRGRRVYTGNLAYAYYNQRYAVDLYNNGQYHNAIEYSLYARRLCYQALQSNGARYPVTRYNDESQFRSRDDRQLNDELRRAYPEQPADDQAVLTFSFNFNVK